MHQAIAFAFASEFDRKLPFARNFRSEDEIFAFHLGDRFLSSAGAGGNCARPMRLADPSPVLDKNRAPMGPEILSSTGAGVWRKAPMAFPDSSSVLDKFHSAIIRKTIRIR